MSESRLLLKELQAIANGAEITEADCERLLSLVYEHTMKSLRREATKQYGSPARWSELV